MDTQAIVDGCTHCFVLQWQYMNVLAQEAQSAQKIPNLRLITKDALKVRCPHHADLKSGLVEVVNVPLRNNGGVN